MKKKTNLTKRLNFRVEDDLYYSLIRMYEDSPHRDFSDFIRAELERIMAENTTNNTISEDSSEYNEPKDDQNAAS